jgi:hypothetical protein
MTSRLAGACPATGLEASTTSAETDSNNRTNGMTFFMMALSVKAACRHQAGRPQVVTIFQRD